MLVSSYASVSIVVLTFFEKVTSVQQHTSLYQRVLPEVSSAAVNIHSICDIELSLTG